MVAEIGGCSARLVRSGMGWRTLTALALIVPIPRREARVDEAGLTPTREENVRGEGKSEVVRKRGTRRSKDEENEEGSPEGGEVVFREEARCLT